MRPTDRDPVPRPIVVPLPLFGDAPASAPARERQHDPGGRPAPLGDLVGRADRLLAAVRLLARESRGGPGVRIERIDAVTEQLGALQAVLAEVAGLALRPSQVGELADARRRITAALILTLELLERAR